MLQVSGSYICDVPTFTSCAYIHVMYLHLHDVNVGTLPLYDQSLKLKNKAKLKVFCV